MKLRQAVLFAGLLAVAVGCRNNFEGPREVYQKNRRGDTADRRVDGQPAYTLDEQKQRGRERLTIPEDDRAVAPYGYINSPSPTGR